MKFDFVIGNPPYHSSVDSYNRQEPIYPFFYDAAESIGERTMLISPAKFLFDAGLTSKEWNKKMLTDEHIKVEYYNQNSSEVFPNTDIKGGVAVIYRDTNKIFGAIEEFFPEESIRKIAKHFEKNIEHNLPSIMYGGRSDLKFNDVFLKEHPESITARLKAVQLKHPDVKNLAPNEEYELKSSTLETLRDLFYEEKPEGGEKYYRILGLQNGKRTFRWIEEKYMEPRYPDNNNINHFKVVYPEANGNGFFGEILSEPIILAPKESATPTFISIGKFNTEIEAKNAEKYIKTKLVRTLLGLIKKTHHTPPANWSYVPVQNFSSESDIKWDTSIKEIDQQLYKKYELSKEDIDFIETHVKEMK